MNNYEKLAISGSHCFLSWEECEKIWQEIKKVYQDYLATYKVKLPKWRSAKSLWLIYLYKFRNYQIHKDTISDFVCRLIEKAGRDQQVRHLAADGWYLLNKGEHIPETNQKVANGYHVLFDIKRPKLSFLSKISKRKGRMTIKCWEELKMLYENKCATCGLLENKNHPRFDKPVTLQKGHMDPNKPETLDNIIPQCQICNQTYRDNFVFDENGYIKAINNENFVLRSKPEVLKKIYELLKKEFE